MFRLKDLREDHDLKQKDIAIILNILNMNVVLMIYKLVF